MGERPRRALRVGQKTIYGGIVRGCPNHHVHRWNDYIFKAKSKIPSPGLGFCSNRGHDLVGPLYRQKKLYMGIARGFSVRHVWPRKWGIFKRRVKISVPTSLDLTPMEAVASSGSLNRPKNYIGAYGGDAWIAMYTTEKVAFAREEGGICKRWAKFWVIDKLGFSTNGGCGLVRTSK